VAVLAGCGSTAARHSASPACTNPAAARATARILTDIAALKHASALPTRSTLKGNAAVNRATDAFLLDVETAPIGNLARNRLIDHAAAALVGSCEQCFQALEADRPIPEIAHKGSACTK
jgi:hypothetical protein